MKRRVEVVGALALALVAGPVAQAEDLVGVLKGFAGAALIRSQARNIDKLLDAVTMRRGGATRAATRVVPVFSVGRKGYVGAAQITGDAAALQGTRIIFEVTGQVEGGQGRFAHMIPSSSSNPLQIRRVRGVSVVATVDASVWGKVGTFPVGGTARNSLLRAGAAVAASRLVGAEINRFLNRVSGHPPPGTTRVVPILTVGEKSYVGLAQVIGPSAMEADAVLQLEENLSGKFRARVFVPVDSSLGLKRVRDVGVGTLVDMTLKTGTRAPGEEPRATVPPVVPGGTQGGSHGGYYEDDDHHHDHQHDHDYGDDDDQGWGRGRGRGRGHGPPWGRDDHPGRGRGPPERGWGRGDPCEDIDVRDSGCHPRDKKCQKNYKKRMKEECKRRDKRVREHRKEYRKRRRERRERWEEDDD